ncbi:unnamed protein product [Urochloa humidicola]
MPRIPLFQKKSCRGSPRHHRQIPCSSSPAASRNASCRRRRRRRPPHRQPLFCCCCSLSRFLRKPVVISLPLLDGGGLRIHAKEKLPLSYNFLLQRNRTGALELACTILDFRKGQDVRLNLATNCVTR